MSRGSCSGKAWHSASWGWSPAWGSGLAGGTAVVDALGVSPLVSPHVEAPDVGRAALIGLGVGVLGGVYPAWAGHADPGVRDARHLRFLSTELVAINLILGQLHQAVENLRPGRRAP